MDAGSEREDDSRLLRMACLAEEGVDGDAAQTSIPTVHPCRVQRLFPFCVTAVLVAISLVGAALVLVARHAAFRGVAPARRDAAKPPLSMSFQQYEPPFEAATVVAPEADLAGDPPGSELRASEGGAAAVPPSDIIAPLLPVDCGPGFGEEAIHGGSRVVVMEDIQYWYHDALIQDYTLFKGYSGVVLSIDDSGDARIIWTDQGVGEKWVLRNDLDKLQRADCNENEGGERPEEEKDFGTCAKPGEDCSSTQCCSEKGWQCYQKNDVWAGCRTTCRPGMLDDLGEAWSCEKLGGRTPLAVACSWSWQACDAANCCNNAGFVCSVKNNTFSGCMRTKNFHRGVSEDVPPPSDWIGEHLPGATEELDEDHEIAAASPGNVAGTSFFCFMAILYGSYEEELLIAAQERSTSIFGCDSYSVYSSEKADYQLWDSGDSTLMNSEVFFHIWDAVKEEGQYLEHDWTVKVDADCVFFPDRLRLHLKKLRPPAEARIYIKNTDPDEGLYGFMGALEIFSALAFQSYIDNAEECQESIGTVSGEDGFMKDCMDALKVGYMLDANILLPGPDLRLCQDDSKVAFHPMKSASNWTCCLDIAAGLNTSCEKSSRGPPLAPQ